MATIVVTGASGSLARKLIAPMEAAGHRLILLDRVAEDPAVVAADLSTWGAWTERFAGADCVIHLAGSARPDADWEEVSRLNVDLTLNVFEAAAQMGVGRVVFASSNWVLAGHRFDGVALDAQAPPAPLNPYGASKLFGERLGRFYAERRGIEAVCLRIGYSQHATGNVPGPHMAWGRWGQSMWLSDRDLVDGTIAAATAPLTAAFGIVNLVSDNVPSRWSMDDAKALMGFVPQDRHEVADPPEADERERLVAAAREDIRAIDAGLMRDRW